MRGKPFQKGHSGKKKGTQNKITKTVKELVLSTFNELQTDKKSNLKQWGKDNPTEFYKIAAKLIPTDIKASVDVAISKIEITRKIIK